MTVKEVMTDKHGKKKKLFHSFNKILCLRHYARRWVKDGEQNELEHSGGWPSFTPQEGLVNAPCWVRQGSTDNSLEVYVEVH